jgi:predicted N-acyltransferase
MAPASVPQLVLRRGLRNGSGNGPHETVELLAGGLSGREIGMSLGMMGGSFRLFGQYWTSMDICEDIYCQSQAN